jgi:hypothetical protein
MARSALSANSETPNTELVGLHVRSGGILRKALLNDCNPLRLQARSEKLSKVASTILDRRINNGENDG